ncbi:MAG: tRNA pseudouridine(55) synthase TruB [Eubacteriales bacterium]|nr:tRNA pseudouridine(55) synthase TruB [Eubacteriales bacterium]
MNGILNVYKEPGFTSFDVVAKLRGICKQKKIGHTGTLDPDASGVLPVCLGNATKLCDMLTDKTKEYRAKLLLGCVTDTQDTTGRILEEHPVTVAREQVRQAILSFVGEYDQIPPMYSALKVNGQKLCDLARAGKVVERKSRRITIYSITIEEMELPFVTMTVSCSKGTYIRTLCHDIGRKLGCGGTMASLVRTRSGQFRIEEAYPLSEIEQLATEGRLESILLPTDAVFGDLPSYTVKKEFEILVKNGNPLLPVHLEAGADSGLHAAGAQGKEAGDSLPEGAQIRVYGGDGRFYGIYGWQKMQARFKPVRMFLG